MIYTGSGDFLKIGNQIVDDIKKHNIISSSSNVLDIGSGIGRIAVPLTQIIKDGQYEGFDIIQSGVRWCEKHITKHHPNFHFK